MGLSCFETVMISRNIWAVNGGCPGGPELATFQGLSVRIFLGWKYLDSQCRCPGGPELATFQGLAVRIFLGWKYLDSN